MKTLEISEIATLLEDFGKIAQPVILTRNGQPIAALFSIEDVDLETLSLSVNPQFATIVEQSRKSQKENGRIFLDEISMPADL